MSHLFSFPLLHHRSVCPCCDLCNLWRHDLLQVSCDLDCGQDPSFDDSISALLSLPQHPPLHQGSVWTKQCSGCWRKLW